MISKEELLTIAADLDVERMALEVALATRQASARNRTLRRRAASQLYRRGVTFLAGMTALWLMVGGEGWVVLIAIFWGAALLKEAGVLMLAQPSRAISSDSPARAH
jgi:hypothetical protein